MLRAMRVDNARGGNTLEASHHCQYPGCCNPTHLFIECRDMNRLRILWRGRFTWHIIDLQGNTVSMLNPCHHRAPEHGGECPQGVHSASGDCPTGQSQDTPSLAPNVLDTPSTWIPMIPTAKKTEDSQQQRNAPLSPFYSLYEDLNCHSIILCNICSNHPSAASPLLFLASEIRIRSCRPIVMAPPVTSPKAALTLQSPFNSLAAALITIQELDSETENELIRTDSSHVPDVSVTGSCHSSMVPPQWKEPGAGLDDKLSTARSQSR